MSKEYTRSITIPGLGVDVPDIIIADNFSNPNLWTLISGDTNYAFDLDPSYSFAAQQSLYLNTGYTNDPATDAITVRRSSYLPASQRIQGTIFFSHPDLTRISWIIFNIHTEDGILRHEYGLRYRPNIPDWSYYNSIGTWTPVSGAALTLENDCWHRLRFNLDINTQQYGYSQLNHTSLAMPTAQGKITVITQPLHFYFEIEIRKASGAAASAYFSNLLIRRY